MLMLKRQNDICEEKKKYRHTRKTQKQKKICDKRKKETHMKKGENIH